jgi:hypothetical protein
MVFSLLVAPQQIELKLGRPTFAKYRVANIATVVHLAIRAFPGLGGPTCEGERLQAPIRNLVVGQDFVECGSQFK